jgi:hypothetical protein
MLPADCTACTLCIHHSASICISRSAEEEFQGFKLKGGSRAAANVPGPLPRYGSSAGLHYMLLAAPAKQVRRHGRCCFHGGAVSQLSVNS